MIKEKHNLLSKNSIIIILTCQTIQYHLHSGVAVEVSVYQGLGVWLACCKLLEPKRVFKARFHYDKHFSIISNICKYFACIRYIL